MNNYLTDDLLCVYLKKLFPDNIFIRDKVVPNSGLKTRPDYRNDDLKLIIEFDGYRHYTVPKVILSDLKKDEVYSKMGYTIVRIPYFVQLTSVVIQNLFNLSIDFNTTFPHGFIVDICARPADFCELGIDRFIMDLDKFSYLKQEILSSLREKEEELDVHLIYPHTLIQYCNNMRLSFFTFFGTAENYTIHMYEEIDKKVDFYVVENGEAYRFLTIKNNLSLFETTKVIKEEFPSFNLNQRLKNSLKHFA